MQKITIPEPVIIVPKQKPGATPTPTSAPSTPPTTEPTVATANEVPTIVRTPNNVPYVLTILGMFLIGVIGIIAYAYARPNDDIAIIIGAVFGILTPTTLSLLAFMKSQETHLSVNSRLDQFIENSRASSYRKGVISGTAQGTLDANARTDQIAGENK